MVLSTDKSCRGSSSNMSLINTQRIITEITDSFQQSLGEKLNLIRVTAPLFVKQNTGLNDTLNGVEEPVVFMAKDLDDRYEIVQSLAKWKRTALRDLGFSFGEGLYTLMRAIRKDEDIDFTHSIYVDQWDWEIKITENQRNIEYLKQTVTKIYHSILEVKAKTDKYLTNQVNTLPNKISFITSQELEDCYGDLTPKEREATIAKEKGAVFIMKIGGLLNSGIKHDNRAPDYDDWTLNGDLILWNNITSSPLEISSMGIRVNKDALLHQCKESKTTDRLKLDYHTNILNNELPLSIGGGIGQSRLCMYLLEKGHIGEVQFSAWPKNVVSSCRAKGIRLL